MSGINGDKSRFNRVRKQRIAQRQRNRELIKNLSAKTSPPPASTGSEAKTKSA